METASMDSHVQKTKTSKGSGTIKRLDLASAKLLAQLKEKANKKDIGRKVLESEIISVALKLVTNEHIKELQAVTYSANDRLMLAYADYQKTNGKITLDEFIHNLLKSDQSKK